MGNKYKEQIMTALSNVSSAEVSHEAYVWAASNLPDSDSTGTERVPPVNMVYDHDASGILKACGFASKDDAKSVLTEIQGVKDALAKEIGEDPSISMVIEKMTKDYYRTGEDRIMRFIGAMFFLHGSSDDPISLLLKLLGGKRD